MASTLTLTPSVPGGGTALDLRSENHRLETGFRFPVPVSENSWIDTRDMEGRRRTHTKPANPTGEGSVVIKGATEAAFRDNLDTFQAAVAAVNKWGGVLAYDPDDAAAVSYTLVAMDITDAPNLDQPPHTWTRLSFQFECEPYGLLANVTIASNQTASAPLLVFDCADVPGHVDALGELTITDTATQERWYVEYGVEAITNASPNDLILSQPDLNVTGLAGASNTRTGSFSTNTYRATLTTTPVAVCSTGNQPHEGLRRIYARVYADTASTYVRAEYRIGDGAWSSNSWALAIEDNWTDAYLGLVNIPEGETFEVRIVAKCATAGGVLDVDIVYPFPADRWGRARRQLQLVWPSAFSARDEFDQSAGGLAGKTLPVGGSWTGAGDADDFAVASGVATRTAVSDAGAGLSSGRFGIAGSTNYALIGVRLDFKKSVQATVAQGVFARYVDTSNFVYAKVRNVSTVPLPGNGLEIELGVRLAGSDVAYSAPRASVMNVDSWYTIALIVDATGRAFVFFGPQGFPEFVTSVSHSSLATGSTLDDGKVGIFDYQEIATANTRTYDNFAAWVPDTEAAIFSGQSMTFYSDRAERENAAGTRSGRVPVFEGQHLKVPVAGREDRTSRIAVRARRNDISEMTDGNLTDALRADLTVTPRVLLTTG